MASSDDASIVPLRSFSPVDSARVRAFRRLARENVLPPVLLWWVSGLLSYVILDGHDRLIAALKEGTPPSFCLLSRRDTDQEEKQCLRSVAEYENLMRYLTPEASKRGKAVASAGRSLAERLTSRSQHATWCWPSTGGPVQWAREASLIDEQWVAALC
ncbi:hypothetical protein B7R25_07815 [Subtercola boreus]|uniref:ParB/Sulfiredoxin domain-containing protein n=1 Tax=Subtercola boreus TaxID=120213 RepID=A0A3E0WD18_9MICO|nr:hypothetical protein B7R24_07745 [Subtercola boreus]RFA21650.1 hypothetical protein B7R23_07690 [Subtercola boreus]RFA27620.1 hypothetical protein B7R25_07815 [Subtercola boreus]